MSVKKSEFVERRQRLLDYLAEQPHSCVAIIAAAHEQTRSNDTEYPFRQDSDFFYLTGFNEPNAILILAPDLEQPVQLLCQPTNPHAEVWHGRRLGVEQAAAALQVDVALSSEHSTRILHDTLAQAHTVYSLHRQQQLQSELLKSAEALRSSPKKTDHAPQTWVDLAPYLAQQRLLKSPAELALMKRAAEISVAAHKRAMTFASPGRFEYQVAAELHHEFAMHGALHPAYGTICGSAENACILHYTENTRCLQDGDLLLIDAGAEFQGYAADITRTFPVNGHFSGEQKALYEVVLTAQLEALAAIKPGQTLPALYEIASRCITQGLLDLGILTGSLAEHMEKQSYREFFIHGLGHWLGLDVHDVGAYQQQGEPVPLQESMVLTIEPGIYIPESMTAVDARWHNLGIRIEDDVVVTAKGHDNLTAATPKTVAEIEQWIQQSRFP